MSEPSLLKHTMPLAQGLFVAGLVATGKLSLDQATRFVPGGATAPDSPDVGDPSALVGAREALEVVLLGDGVQEALQWLLDAGLLGSLFPELAATVGFDQEAGRRHKDVWKHTKQVVSQATKDVAVRWAALFHDIGKVATRAFTADGKVTFHGHAELGARMWKGISRRLACPKPLGQKVHFLILNHLRASQYDGSWTDAAVRRFDRDMREHLQALFELSRADITSQNPRKKEHALEQLDELARRILAIRECDARTPPLPSGLGNHLMERFHLPAGRLIGELRGELEAQVEAGTLEPGREAEYYLTYLAQQSARLKLALSDG